MASASMGTATPSNWSTGSESRCESCCHCPWVPGSKWGGSLLLARFQYCCYRGRRELQSALRFVRVTPAGINHLVPVQ